jgi:hypothetical protein
MAETRPAHPLAIDNGSMVLNATDYAPHGGRIMKKRGSENEDEFQAAFFS